MAVDDFLLVVGDGWIEINNATEFVRTTTGEPQMIEFISNGEWPQLSQYLEDYGLIEPNSIITDARIINTGSGEDNIKMWFKL